MEMEYPDAWAVWTASPPMARGRSSTTEFCEAWRKQLKAGGIPPVGEVLESLEAWKRSKKWAENGGEYIEGIHRWVNRRQWENRPMSSMEMAEEDFAKAAFAVSKGDRETALVENFVAYWTERNLKTGRMRWEDENYFDMGRRLATSRKLGYGNEPFTPPTGSEVRAYAAEKGMPEQWANDFYGHYKSVGWMVGKVKMADWKAKLAIWCNAQLKREAV